MSALWRIEVANLDDLIERYRSGASLKQLSRESGYGRNVLFRRFSELGVPVRSRSDAERMKWRGLDSDARHRRLAIAHAARRGMRDSLAVRIRRAQTMMRRLARVGSTEHPVVEAIRAKDGRFVEQVSIGPYNVDAAIPKLRVAVEVQTSNRPRGEGSIRRERMEYLLDSKWSVLVVHATSIRKRGFNATALAEKVHAFTKAVGGHPSLRGQYGVIGSDGQPMTPACYDLPQRPRVPGF